MRPLCVVSFLAIIYQCAHAQSTCPATGADCTYNKVAVKPATNNEPNRHYYIGGLFGIHERTNDAYACDNAPIREEELINLEAFLWAIERYKSIHSNISIGGVAFDTCSRYQKTIEDILSFETCKIRVSDVNPPTPRNLLAYIGPGDNYDAMSSARLLKDMNKTQVSYGASTNLLSNKDPSASEIMTIADAVFAKVKTRHVVVLAPESQAKKFLSEMKNRNPQKFTQLIFFGSWNPRAIEGLEVNAYTTSLQSPSNYDTDVNSFYLHLDNLKPGENSKNRKWYEEYFRSKVGCNSLNCDYTNKTILGKYQKSPHVPYILAAVKAVIQGVKNGATKACTSGDLCSNYLNVNNRGQQIYTGIINTTDLSVPYFQTSGSMKGDASNSLSNLKILLYDASKSESIEVATYNPSSGLQLEKTITAYSSSCPSSPCLECNELPVTTTSTASPTSRVTVSTTTDPTEGGKYALLRFPYNEEMTGIFPPSGSRDLYDTRFKTGQRWIIALGVLAGLGVLAVLIFEVYILYKLLGTRIGRQWRTMWLGQLLLLGIFLSYLTLFAFIVIPTDVTCGITRFGVGFCYSILFAVLLVKLMVLLTSKSSDSILADMESPNYLKGIYQFLMFMFAVGVQVVINVQWLIQVPPYAVKVTANYGGEEWICNHFTWQASMGWNDMQNFVRTPFENHLLSLLYIMFLILMTTIVAMKAHGIITNHRESVFIGIAAGFSIPVWIAWGLVGGLNRDNAYAHEYGDACIAFGLFATATLCLFALFLPKVRQLVNMGVEGIYLEDDRDTYYAGSVVMAPPSYKSRPSSMIYVNSGEYSNPVVIGNGDPNHLKHPGSMYSGHSAPVYTKRNDLGGSRVLRVTGDLTGKHPTERRRPVSEIGYSGYAGSYRKTRSESGGTLRKSRSEPYFHLEMERVSTTN
uniref:Metabotropic glutamate receptor 2 n=1 Tax=Magallana gigas TaxID=29159 RepID=K1QQK5_MAGGI